MRAGRLGDWWWVACMWSVGGVGDVMRSAFHPIGPFRETRFFACMTKTVRDPVRLCMRTCTCMYKGRIRGAEAFGGGAGAFLGGATAFWGGLIVFFGGGLVFFAATKVHRVPWECGSSVHASCGGRDLGVTCFASGQGVLWGMCVWLRSDVLYGVRLRGAIETWRRG